MLKKGSLLLKTWCINEYLGEGACGKVYSVSLVPGSKVLPVDYELVAKVIPLGNSLKNAKDRKAQQNICNTLYHEYILSNGALLGFPLATRRPERYFGDDQDLGVRFFVMERMEEDLIQRAIRKKLSPIELSSIGLSILSGLEWIHSRKFLYIDIKPENFMMKGDRLVFIDFGLTSSMSKGGAAEGTPGYWSIGVHKGRPIGVRDEIESMGYALLSIASQNSLPWMNSSSDAEILRLKECVNLEEFASAHQCDEIFQIISISRNWSSASPFDYDAIRLLLQKLGKRTPREEARKTIARTKESERQSPRHLSPPKKSAKGALRAATETKKAVAPVVDLIDADNVSCKKGPFSRSNTAQSPEQSFDLKRAFVRESKSTKRNQEEKDSPIKKRRSTSPIKSNKSNSWLLTVTSGPHLGLKRQFFIGTSFTIGGSNAYDIKLDKDMAIEKRHAECTVTNESINIKGSSSLIINGRSTRMGRWIYLDHGSKIQLGDTEINFQLCN